jgi:hypothetical protein
MHCSARPDDCIPNQSVYYHQTSTTKYVLGECGWVYGLSPARDLSARSTTIKRVKKVSPNRIDPERSRTTSAWRRSMSWWVDGKQVFVLPPGRGPSAGRRRAIAMRCALRTATPSTLVLPALPEQQLQATSAKTREPFVSALLPCALSCSYSRDPVRDHAASAQDPPVRHSTRQAPRTLTEALTSRRSTVL